MGIKGVNQSSKTEISSGKNNLSLFKHNTSLSSKSLAKLQKSLEIMFFFTAEIISATAEMKKALRKWFLRQQKHSPQCQKRIFRLQKDFSRKQISTFSPKL